MCFYRQRIEILFFRLESAFSSISHCFLITIICSNYLTMWYIIELAKRYQSSFFGALKVFFALDTSHDK